MQFVQYEQKKSKIKRRNETEEPSSKNTQFHRKQ